jgi:hypothetical protein
VGCILPILDDKYLNVRFIPLVSNLDENNAITISELTVIKIYMVV